MLDSTGIPVAKIGGDVDDRWTSVGGELNGQLIVLGTINEVTMGLSYVVDPQRWVLGFGRAALESVIRDPATTDVRLFVA